MSESISAILDVHDTPRTRNDSQNMLLSLAGEAPDQLGELIRVALARRSPASAFLDMALDLLPDEAVEPVCADAWRRYRDGERGELLASVLEFASYQAPQVLQDDWEALLAVAIEDELQLASQVWQGLPLPLPHTGRRSWPKPTMIAKWRGPGRCCWPTSQRPTPLPAATWSTGGGWMPRSGRTGPASPTDRSRGACMGSGRCTSASAASSIARSRRTNRAGASASGACTRPGMGTGASCWAHGRTAGGAVWQLRCAAAAPVANRRCRAATRRGG